jgi:hypothetical protein
MSDLGTWSTLAIGLTAFLLLRAFSQRAKNQQRKYLPGPPRLPLIGNLLQMPPVDAWETYLKWKDIYGARGLPTDERETGIILITPGEHAGDAIYLEVLGAPVVVLNTYQACVDLLEKRSDIYSDRPRNVVGNKMSVIPILIPRVHEIGLTYTYTSFIIIER